MNEELIKWLRTTLEKGKDLVVLQAPEVVQQVVGWSRFRAGVTTIVLTVVSVIGFVVVHRLVRSVVADVNGEHPNEDAIFWKVLLGSAAAMIALAFLVNAYMQGMTWIQWVCYPKAALLELATKIIP